MVLFQQPLAVISLIKSLNEPNTGIYVFFKKNVAYYYINTFNCMRLLNVKYNNFIYHNGGFTWTVCVKTYHGNWCNTLVSIVSIFIGGDGGGSVYWIPPYHVIITNFCAGKGGCKATSPHDVHCLA